MMYLPIVLFPIAAVGGLTLVVKKYFGKGVPWPLVIGHEIFASLGLVVLLVNVFQVKHNILMNLSLILFLITTIGGFAVLSAHLRNDKQPYRLILVHGSAAVISFILLMIAITR